MVWGADKKDNTASKMKQYITNSDKKSVVEENNTKQSRNTISVTKKDNAHNDHSRPLNPNHCSTQATYKDISVAQALV